MKRRTLSRSKTVYQIFRNTASLLVSLYALIFLDLISLNKTMYSEVVFFVMAFSSVSLLIFSDMMNLMGDKYDRRSDKRTGNTYNQQVSPSVEDDHLHVVIKDGVIYSFIKTGMSKPGESAEHTSFKGKVRRLREHNFSFFPPPDMRRSFCGADDCPPGSSMATPVINLEAVETQIWQMRLLMTYPFFSELRGSQ
jgi:hypothetical protein